MKQSTAPVVPPKLLVPFLLVTLLFPLWGFANDITNPMVAAFKNILLLSNFESSLVQGAFYGGYALMAIPAAIFITRFTYKKGILLGLGLYALGCLLFIPAGWTLSFYPFLFAYLVMTSGLSFLETTANPYILSMGDESTATRRLNLAQAFNPMGSIIGMFVASMVILVNLNSTSESTRRILVAAADQGQSAHLQVSEKIASDLDVLQKTISEPNWTARKRSAKKAEELTAALTHDLDLLVNPHADRIPSIREALTSTPRSNPFVEALRSVAVVLQLLPAPTPSLAEKEQQEFFGGPVGMELATILDQETQAAKALPEFKEGKAALANALPMAEAVLAETSGIYSALNEGSQADKSTAADQVSSTILSLEKAILDAKQAFAALPILTLQPVFEKFGDEFAQIRETDLFTVVGPYALMGGLLLLVFLFFVWKLPASVPSESGTSENRSSSHQPLHIAATLKRLRGRPRYWEGVIAQTFYVGAQIMCWTFIIQYAELELGISKATAQNCNILAMVIFVSSRFVCTFLLHYVSPGFLIGLLALGGILFTGGTIFLQGYAGLYCLIAVSACMSLMFPTIYGIALKGLGDDAKLASSGLILAIGGGCVLPVLQGKILDLPPFNFGFMELSSIRASFFLPLLCFVVIAIYGARTLFVHDRTVKE